MGYSSDGYFEGQISNFPTLTASFSIFYGLILMDLILYPRRRNLDHSTPWDVEYPEYFLTICCRPMGTNQLCKNGQGEKILDLAQRYQETHRWHCSIALLMPDHLHAIVQIPQRLKLVSVVRSFKQAGAKQAGVLWQRGFFEHRIRDDESAQQKYRYIEMNPVRAGLVKKAEDWPWRVRFNDR
jgi:REP element-mobilizing transposase RayT